MVLQKVLKVVIANEVKLHFCRIAEMDAYKCVLSVKAKDNLSKSHII
jgi:hypothetical protein